MRDARAPGRDIRFRACRFFFFFPFFERRLVACRSEVLTGCFWSRAIGNIGGGAGAGHSTARRRLDEAGSRAVRDPQRRGAVSGIRDSGGARGCLGRGRGPCPALAKAASVVYGRIAFLSCRCYLAAIA